MKLKVLLLLTIGFSFSLFAQRGVRIGYIDTEYILENVPEYKEATTQLASKVEKWKSEIDTKLNTVEQKRKDLNNEKALLTSELIAEREEDLAFEEKEILDYQQKRFGPNGDLMIQKRQLIAPVQDQIFAAVQEIAKNKKYDFVFDKSADVVMLYSAQRFDISDLVLRSITRASKRTQAKTKAERKAAQLEDDNASNLTEAQIERKKEAEAKRAERKTAAEKRRETLKAQREERLLKIKKRRDSIINARKLAKQNKLNARTKSTKTDINGSSETQADEKVKAVSDRKKAIEAKREERRAALIARRKKILEARKKAKEEREAKQKAKEENN